MASLPPYNPNNTQNTDDSLSTSQDQSSAPSTPPADVDFSVLGTGCLTSCSGGCLIVAIGALGGGIIGVQAVRESFGLPFIGFILGLLTHIAVGYFVARAAREKNAAVNLHVLIVGAILMILGLLAFVIPQPHIGQTERVKDIMKALQILSWISIIPLMMVGAYWSREES